MKKLVNWDMVTHKRYDDFIDNIINTRGQWNIPDGEYFEGHHILPKCAGGTGKTRQKDKNIIWLYPKEHYIAHKILSEENPTSHQLMYAFIAMSTIVNDYHERYTLTADEYELCKNLNCNAGKLRWDNLTDEEKQNRIQKQKLTISNQSSEFKIKAEEKRKITRENRSEERTQEIHNNMSIASKASQEKRLKTLHKTLENRTDEEKIKISQIRSEAIKKSDREDNGERIRKQKQTKANKSDKEKLEIITKQKNTFKNRTQRQKDYTLEKLHHTLANKSDAEKALTSKKLSDAYNRLSTEQKQKREEKRLQTLTNRTEEEKLASKNKFKQSMANRTAEDRLITSKKLSDVSIGRSFYNNGVECHRYYEGQVPDGYIKGRLKYKGGKN